eukprot:Blabericola_migrator_1__13495@NODE_97_length_14383_cov_97_669181_g87_i0_p6_GENE_NODE_97_length_14383_cov_97_669181_g87_i0NODE_97_length_14383_cov_97_669181_g87_i0_p6_ORF_typecomplete_len318_score45_78LRR_9/PF14580_6/4_3e03LRR_9/PF14580_6/1_1e07LRR_9/PF14580_6/1e07LRR_8/PF13855_6/20LRR_8/PF13855_6/4_3LRR_8/PF13855_6/0_00073LRR_8/PF13855_6/1_9e05LRR_8/PF13855_6/0_0044LRR_8/PF13855_6/9LRR_4/PF12799_7/2e02LRR_4/PF12799_7/1_4LRR_4/PF12799_7/0_0017LRR_4/PF12799_7/0_012LRR_4/PF12799_7/1_2e03LRR_4/PF127
MTPEKGPWQLLIKSDARVLELSIKQRHLDTVAGLRELLEGPFQINRFLSDATQVVVDLVPKLLKREPVDESPVDPWNVTLDLSRNFFHSCDVDEFVGLFYDRLTSLRDAVDEGNAHLAWVKDELSNVPLSSVAQFAAQITSICLTSNMLQSSPVFSKLTYPRLTHLLINQNHITQLDADRCYAQHAPMLRYLDAKHNRLTSLETLRDFLGPTKRLEVLLLSCNFLKDNLSTLVSYLPEGLPLRTLGLFSNMLSDKGRSEAAVDDFLVQLSAKYPSLEEISISGNPIVTNVPKEGLQRMVRAALPKVNKLDGFKIAIM